MIFKWMLKYCFCNRGLYSLCLRLSSKYLIVTQLRYCMTGDDMAKKRRERERETETRTERLRNRD